MTQSKDVLSFAYALQNEIKTMCVCTELDELYETALHAQNHLKKLRALRYKQIKAEKEQHEQETLRRDQREL